MNLEEKLKKIEKALPENQEVEIIILCKKSNHKLILKEVCAAVGKIHNVALFDHFEVDSNPNQPVRGV